MAVTRDKAVLADINHTYAVHLNQKAVFYTTTEQFFIRLNKAGLEGEYPITCTLGYFPLQQYLVETSCGTCQVLPFASDSQRNRVGRQRWFHVCDIDCYNLHSGKVVADGDQDCPQCLAAVSFDTATFRGHPQRRAASQYLVADKSF